MRALLILGFAVISGVWGCGATIGDRGPSTPQDVPSSDDGSRFTELESLSTELGPDRAADLPEVVDEDMLFIVEAAMGTPAVEEETGRMVIVPPESWTIGATESGEEVRFEFLQPEGGAIVISGAEGIEAEEVALTFILRYARRNVLLTEAGTSLAVHVIPVAARLDVEGQAPRFWIASEAASSRGSPQEP